MSPSSPSPLLVLKPALEELLALYEDGVVDPEQEKTVVIAVRDCEEGTEAELEEAVGERLKALWKAAVKPEVCVRARARGHGWVRFSTKARTKFPQYVCIVRLCGIAGLLRPLMTYMTLPWMDHLKHVQNKIMTDYGWSYRKRFFVQSPNQTPSYPPMLMVRWPSFPLEERTKVQNVPKSTLLEENKITDRMTFMLFSYLRRGRGVRRCLAVLHRVRCAGGR